MATYTSVSLMSTSAWNGPGGSPIISPSRWNTLVASNLLVIENHDHAASAGEGEGITFDASYFPTMDVQYISPWFPISSASWVMENRTGWPGMGCMSTSALGSTIEYDTYLRSGRWLFYIMAGLGSAAGFLAASIGGSILPLGEQGAASATDRYNAGGEVPNLVSGSFSNAAIPVVVNKVLSSIDAGRYSLRFQCTGKNDASTGYISRLGYIFIYRYAAP